MQVGSPKVINQSSLAILELELPWLSRVSTIEASMGILHTISVEILAMGAGFMDFQ